MRRGACVPLSLALLCACGPPCKVGALSALGNLTLIRAQSEVGSSVRFLVEIGECRPGEVPVPAAHAELPSGGQGEVIVDLDQRKQDLEAGRSGPRAAYGEARFGTSEAGTLRLVLDFLGEERELLVEVVSAPEVTFGRSVRAHCVGPIRDEGDEILCQDVDLGRIPTVRQFSRGVESASLGRESRLWRVSDGFMASMDGGIGRVGAQLADWRPEVITTLPIDVVAAGSRYVYVGSGSVLEIHDRLDGGVMQLALREPTSAQTTLMIGDDEGVAIVDARFDGGLHSSVEVVERTGDSFATARTLSLNNLPTAHDARSWWGCDLANHVMHRYPLASAGQPDFSSPHFGACVGDGGPLPGALIMTNATLAQCPRVDVLGAVRFVFVNTTSLSVSGCTQRSVMATTASGNPIVYQTFFADLPP